MKSKYILLVFLLTLLSLSTQAIGTFVVGVVVDKATQEPVISANVWFEGTTIGTLTDENGKFMLQSETIQQYVNASSIGYKPSQVDVSDPSELIVIYLDEDIDMLSEVVVVPGENPAFRVLKNIRDHRDQNDVKKREKYTLLAHEKTQLVLDNIPKSADAFSAAHDLTDNAIELPNGNRIIPVYLHNFVGHVTVTKDSTSTKILDQQKNTFHILPEKSWDDFVDYYQPEIDFYNDNIMVLDNKFLGPVSPSAQGTYHLYLDDSLYYEPSNMEHGLYYPLDYDTTFVSGEKRTSPTQHKLYHITFKPKTQHMLLFQGEMWVDSTSWAITRVQAFVPEGLNINYLKKFNLDLKYTKIDDLWWESSHKYTMDIDIDIIPEEINPFHEASLTESARYSHQSTKRRSLDPKVLSPAELYATLPKVDTDMDNDLQIKSINKINNTPTQQVLFTAVDMGINGYVNAGYVDIGPITNMMYYNPYEGQSLRMSLRTSEKIWRNTTIGGFFGYGARDHKYKYGGNIQYRTGVNPRHTFGLYYDHKAQPYGYDTYYFLHENHMDEIYNMFTLNFSDKLMPRMALQEHLYFKYTYDKPALDGAGYLINWEVGASRTFNNHIVPIENNGSAIDHVDLAYSRLTWRFSWNQRSFDNYFHRVYLKTPYPVIHAILEGGYYDTGQDANPYGKFTLMMRQTYPSYYGKLYINMTGTYIFGDVPFQLLENAKAQRGASYDRAGFSTLNQMELVADKYVGAHFRLQTKGYVFNKIPALAKYNWREDLLLGVAYGDLSSSQKSITDLNLYHYDYSIPFVEAGVGVSNIWRVLALQSVWRITHRNEPEALRWGFKFLLSIDF